MSKYSSEFKLEVVKYCIEKNHGIDNDVKHFNIPSVQTVRKWVKRYQEHGTKGDNLFQNYGLANVNVI